MAQNSEAQTKVRILAIAKMLNEGRRINTNEISRRLDLQYDIRVDRKTIYHDMYDIGRVIPIDVSYGPNGGYKKYDVMEAMEDGR